MTPEELRTAMAEGKSPVDIAAEKGMTKDALSIAVQAAEIRRTVERRGPLYVFFGNDLWNPFTAVLYQTLSEDQIMAAAKMYPLGGPLFSISDREPIEKPQATYTFKIVIPENRGFISNYLDMPLFSASVLLPAFGLAHVYSLCYSLLSWDDFQTLNEVTIALLQHYEKVDCRDVRVFLSTPTELLLPLLK